MTNIMDGQFAISVDVLGPLFTDGFEASDDPTFSFAKWDGVDIGLAPNQLNLVEYSTINPHHGVNSYKSTVYAGGMGNGGWSNIYKLITGTNPVYARFYMRIDQLAPAGTDVRFVDAAESQGRYALCYWGQKNNAGQAQWNMRVMNNGTWVEYTGANCNINQTYCVEIAFYRGTGADGWANLWVNGVQIFNITGITSTRTLNTVGLGHCFSNANATNDTSIYYDCVVINDSPIGCEI